MYRRARNGIGYLAQEPSVFRRLTVEENVHLVLQMAGYSRTEQKEKTDQLLEELRINHVRKSPGYTLSGGERRRAEIARALALSPKFILLDEPFTGVDPMAIDDIQEIILDLRKQDIGILITDHNVRETFAITDRAYIIYEGQVKTSGLSEGLPDDPLAKAYYLGDNFKV